MERPNGPDLSRDAQEAFRDAIAAGRLSLDRNADNYVGHYMFMGRWGARDTFKHRLTRKYID